MNHCCQVASPLGPFTGVRRSRFRVIFRVTPETTARFAEKYEAYREQRRLYRLAFEADTPHVLVKSHPESEKQNVRY